MSLPRPQVEIPHKKVPHHSFHMTKTSVKSNSVVCESFDEAMLVLLAEETQDEGFLAGLDDPVCSVHEDACGGGDCISQASLG